jgi:hypothetical protein
LRILPVEAERFYVPRTYCVLRDAESNGFTLVDYHVVPIVATLAAMRHLAAQHLTADP